MGQLTVGSNPTPSAKTPIRTGGADAASGGVRHAGSADCGFRSRPGKGIVFDMNTALAIILVIAIIVVVAAIVVLARRRKVEQLDARRREATETRDLAKISQIEADTRAAEAEERAARAKRESLAAEQQELAAAAHRSTAQDLQSRADAIDPDVENQ